MAILGAFAAGVAVGVAVVLGIAAVVRPGLAEAHDKAMDQLRAVNRQLATMAPALRGLVYGAIVMAGERGITRQEIADAHDLRLQTVCGRVGELIGQGLVWEGDDVGDRRNVLRVVTRI